MRSSDDVTELGIPADWKIFGVGVFTPKSFDCQLVFGFVTRGAFVEDERLNIACKSDLEMEKISLKVYKTLFDLELGRFLICDVGALSGVLEKIEN